MIGNRYATLYTDAGAVARVLAASLDDLLASTRLYRDVLFRSTMPPELLDSAAGRVAVARSPTMFRTAEGVVLGTEGNGCCPLNCTHVYGYTTLLERLFPDLAKDMRVSDFVRHFDDVSGVSMRWGTGGFAIDGSLASSL